MKCALSDRRHRLSANKSVSAIKLMMCSLPLTGDTLFQMAEVHRQIQVQLEDVVRPEKLNIYKSQNKVLSFLLAGSDLSVVIKRVGVPALKCFRLRFS